MDLALIGVPFLSLSAVLAALAVAGRAFGLGGLWLILCVLPVIPPVLALAVMLGGPTGPMADLLPVPGMATVLGAAPAAAVLAWWLALRVRRPA
jgi:hypothetical protein